MLTAEAIGAARPGPLGRSLSVVDCTASTNDDLLAAARAGAGDGTVLVADRQTGGRGRVGKTWHSPPGTNLYLSILLRPEVPELRLLPPLSLVAGLGVAEAVRSVAPVDARLKWPNDVLVDGARKVAGILVETADCASSRPILVIGIGLNVNQTSFPTELESIATSLRLETRAQFDRAEVAAALLRRVHERVTEAVFRGAETALVAWSALSCTLGRRVRTGDGLEGCAQALAPSGALLVRDDDGAVHEVVAGLVEEV